MGISTLFKIEYTDILSLSEKTSLIFLLAFSISKVITCKTEFFSYFNICLKIKRVLSNCCQTDNPPIYTYELGFFITLKFRENSDKQGTIIDLFSFIFFRQYFFCKKSSIEYDTKI